MQTPDELRQTWTSLWDQQSSSYSKTLLVLGIKNHLKKYQLCIMSNYHKMIFNNIYGLGAEVFTSKHDKELQILQRSTTQYNTT